MFLEEYKEIGMGKFDGILICTDCDGTLTDANGELSEENAKAIKYFQEEGGRFTLATGRFPKHLDKYADKIRVNAPVISLNGVLLYDMEQEKSICDLPMQTEDSLEVLEYINENWKGIWEYWINYLGSTSACYKPLEDKFESEILPMAEEYKRKFCEASGDLEKRPVFQLMKEVIPEKTAKIVFVMPEEMLRPLQKDLREKFGGRFHFDSSWANGLEMQGIKSSKGIAVKKLKECLGDIKLTVCVGDYDNDISMLKVADISYAVGNATEEVKNLADRVTVTNNESAIAKIINEIEHGVNSLRMSALQQEKNN